MTTGAPRIEQHLIVGGERDLARIDSQLLARVDQPQERVAALARDRVDAVDGHGGGLGADDKAPHTSINKTTEFGSFFLRTNHSMV